MMKINWGKGLVIFFIIFFAWVLFFVLFALRQNIDLVSDDYYQKGAKYTDQININRRSAAYQDSLLISTTGNQVKIVMGKGLASAGDSVQVYFFRSSDKAKDLRFNFKKTDSPFQIDKDLLSHGRYQVYISWKDMGEKYMVNKVLDVE